MILVAEFVCVLVSLLSISLSFQVFVCMRVLTSFEANNLFGYLGYSMLGQSLVNLSQYVL